jgi:hypothetical protein
VYFIIIQMLESNILGPRIVGHAVGLHPVASILALIAGAQLFGAFGALLATPIVGAIWVVIVSLYGSIRGESADTMLSRRRATPWIRRRSHDSHTKIRREREHLTGNTDGSNKSEKHSVEEPPQETALQVKGISTSGKVEHIDLLRPVYRPDQPTDEQKLADQ